MISMWGIIIMGNVFLFSYSNKINIFLSRQGHPMKPHRIRMTHNLILNYGLYRKMEVYVRKFDRIFFKVNFFSSRSVHIKQSLMK
jgi:hypothetical protein